MIVATGSTDPMRPAACPPEGEPGVEVALEVHLEHLLEGEGHSVDADRRVRRAVSRRRCG